MFGRKRNFAMQSPYPAYSSYYNLPVYGHNGSSFNNRNMPQQNPAYPPSYNHQYWGQMQQMNPSSPYMHFQQPYNLPQMGSGWQGQGGQNGYGQQPNVSQLLFENPLQSQTENPYGGYYPQQEMPYQNMNPYPQQAFLPKQPGGFQSIMNSFKSQDGNLDLNKMVDTAGQMMSAVTQVSSMVKGLGGILKV